MRLSTWYKLQLREALDAPDTPANNDSADQHYHGYGGDGYGYDSPVAKQPLTAPPPGMYEMEQNGDLFLVHRAQRHALVVDQRQHYHIIRFKDRKHWWKGPRGYLGAIGREKALQALDKLA